MLTPWTYIKWSLYIGNVKIPSVMGRPHPCMLLKLGNKIAGVQKTAGFCNLCNGFLGGTQKYLGHINAVIG